MHGRHNMRVFWVFFCFVLTLFLTCMHGPLPPLCFPSFFFFFVRQECAECGSSDIEWASVNIGITLCEACAAIHRTLSASVRCVE